MKTKVRVSCSRLANNLEECPIYPPWAGWFKGTVLLARGWSACGGKTVDIYFKNKIITEECPSGLREQS